MEILWDTQCSYFLLVIYYELCNPLPLPYWCLICSWIKIPTLLPLNSITVDEQTQFKTQGPCPATTPAFILKDNLVMSVRIKKQSPTSHF